MMSRFELTMPRIALEYLGMIVLLRIFGKKTINVAAGKLLNKCGFLAAFI